MATTQTMPIAQEGQSRHRLRNFMRRLAKRKPSPGPSADQVNGQSRKIQAPLHCGNVGGTAHTSLEAARPSDQPDHLPSNNRLSHSMTDLSKAQSQSHSQLSLPTSTDENCARTTGARSIAPTIATQPGTTHSDARSKAGTYTTGGGALSTHELGGEGSTFSSPAPSVRSLTTTLTTIQSTAPGVLLTNAQNAPQSSASTHFTHQFPTTPTPASAIPPHVAHTLNGSSHPHTYSTATANNVLTDDASIMTLASSTKRRRRNSLDTNASVRALAPNSVFGGSRESLPLSVLSANMSSQEPRDTQTSGPASGAASFVGGHTVRPSLAGTAAAERASVYSGSGVLAGTSGEGRETRSSYYANRTNADAASVRSGLLGHGRNDSITGSIGGQASPLASPVVAEEK